MNDHVQIGELARMTGLNTSAIRYYESQNLLPAPERTRNGYRIYSEAHRARLDFILRARSLGLSLDEIREILQFRERGSAPCNHVERLLLEKMNEVEAKINQLLKLQEELKTLYEQARALATASQAENNGVCQIIETH